VRLEHLDASVSQQQQLPMTLNVTRATLMTQPEDDVATKAWQMCTIGKLSTPTRTLSMLPPTPTVLSEPFGFWIWWQKQ